MRDQAIFHSRADAAGGSPSLPRIGHVTDPIERSLRIGVFTDNPISSPDRDVVASVHETADLLSGLGHHVENIPTIVDAEFADQFLAYWALLAFLIRWSSKLTIDRRFNGRKMEPWSRGLVRHFSRRIHRVRSNLRWLRRYEARYELVMQAWDVIVCPTTATPAPEIGHLAPDLPFDTHRERIVAFLPYTPPWNVTGAPAISLPLGTAQDGMPVGVQLGGRLGDEATLLALSLQLEAASEFSTL